MASKSPVQLISLAAALLVVVCSLTPLLAAAEAALQLDKAGKNCSDKCGDVEIPYPFGMSDECSLDENFFITCNRSFTPPKPFLGRGNINVTEISLDGELRVLKYIGRRCYDDSGIDFEPELTLVKFSINDTLNKFVVVGCDSYGYLEGVGLDKFTTGCMSICNNPVDVDNGTCDGVGCCKTSIPKDLLLANLTVGSFNNHTGVLDFNPCTYALLVEDEKFKFSSDNLTNLQYVVKLPLVLAWTIGEETCEEAKKNGTSYACQGNSICYDMPEGYSGYRCSCLEGYKGNPYLPDGCQDINECEDERHPNECTYPDKKYCKNTVGNYTCSCPKGYSGEGRGKDGCKKNEKMKIAYIVIGVVISIVVVFVTVSWLHLKWKREKFIEMRDKFYQDNGGLTLEQILISQGNSLTIYKEKEIIEATDNFNESNKLGEGGFGTVYKGMLKDVLVAVKKSKLSDASKINHRNQIELFVNELAVLSRINHINVVKLLGCCLETEIPMLVYEFIGNKTLSYHLHANNDAKGTSLPWETRLTIATEAADVLSYLHSKASPPILHRDIKPDNILLDGDFTAKVADFGASTLIPLDDVQAHTILVQATRGYLDPEYLQSGQLTEKSDVYSFGVMLAELLTGKRAFFKDGAMQPRSLASYFLTEMEEGRLHEILDSSIVSEEHLEQLQEAANLVKSCLSMKGDDRPAMKDVFFELEKIKKKNSTAQAEMDSADQEVPHSARNRLISANQSGVEMVQTQFWSVNISDFAQPPA